MLDEIAQSFQTIVDGISYNYIFVGKVIGLMWIILFVNRLLGKRLCVLGIYPRHLFGLVGIIFAPFLHYDYEHLLFNSIPLFLLMNFVLLSGYQTFYRVSIFILLIAGGLIWLFGRRAIHIGASYLIMGYFGYLLSSAYITGGTLTIGLAIIAIYYFGGMLFSVLPVEDKTSWEGHLFGLIAGIVTCFVLNFN
jgi:membrane associated rhomboid family serine protease